MIQLSFVCICTRCSKITFLHSYHRNERTTQVCLNNCILSIVCSLIHSFTPSLILNFLSMNEHTYVGLSTLACILSFDCSFVCSFVHLIIHSFIN